MTSIGIINLIHIITYQLLLLSAFHHPKCKPIHTSTLISPSPTLYLPSPPPLLPVPFSLTITQWTGGLLLAEGLLQTADDAVLVSKALAVGRPQGLHLAPVVDPVPLQLDPVLVSLVLQLLEMGVLL